LHLTRQRWKVSVVLKGVSSFANGVSERKPPDSEANPLAATILSRLHLKIPFCQARPPNINQDLFG
jgi:hypothetical protein